MSTEQDLMPDAYAVIDHNGNIEYSVTVAKDTPTESNDWAQEMCHAHINDAIWNDADSAGTWVVRPLYIGQAARQQAVAMPETDEINQMAFEEGQPAEDCDGYLFTMEEFDLFVERLLSEAASQAEQAVALGRYDAGATCKGFGCGTADGNHSTECLIEHDVAVSGITEQCGNEFPCERYAGYAGHAISKHSSAREKKAYLEGVYAREPVKVEQGVPQAAPPAPDVSGLVDSVAALMNEIDRVVIDEQSYLVAASRVRAELAAHQNREVGCER